MTLCDSIADSTGIVFIDNDDPFLNLAAESVLFEKCCGTGRFMLLWKNRTSIVVGRAQNPWIECSVRKAGESGIPVVRRRTGGGTVFHDCGNLNFSFPGKNREGVRENNIDIVISALKNSGIDAVRTERNDITVEGKKVSGNAFRISRGRILHHGTLLVDADTQLLSALLKTELKAEEFSGVASVRSPVANLRSFQPSLTVRDIEEALVREFRREAGGECSIITLSQQDLEQESEVCSIRDELASWEWTYGKTPACVLYAESGTDRGGSIRFRLKNGLIEDISVGTQRRGHDLSRFIDWINEKLRGVPFEKGEVSKSLRKGPLPGFVSEDEMGVMESITEAVP